MAQVAPGIYYPDPIWRPATRILGLDGTTWAAGSRAYGGVPNAPMPQSVQAATGFAFNGRNARRGFGPGYGQSVSPLPTVDSTVGFINQAPAQPFVPR